MKSSIRMGRSISSTNSSAKAGKEASSPSTASRAGREDLPSVAADARSDGQAAAGAVTRRTPGLDGIAAWPCVRLCTRRSRTRRAASWRPGWRDADISTNCTARRAPAVFSAGALVSSRLGLANVAAAFDKLHESNIVVGDVNQGNLPSSMKRCASGSLTAIHFKSGAASKPSGVPSARLTSRLPSREGIKLRDVEGPHRRPRSLWVGHPDLPPTVRWSTPLCRQVLRRRRSND